MKKSFLISLIALGAFMSSCKNDMLESSPKGVTVKIKAIQNGDTKTSVNDASVLWASGDMLKVYSIYNSSAADSALFTLTSGSESTIGQFTGTLQNTAATAGRKFFAIYPSQQNCPQGAATSYYIMWKQFTPGGVSSAKKLYFVEFAVPERQVQNLQNPADLGKYTIMVSTPVSYENEVTSGTELQFSFNQLCSVLDFKLNNIPAGKSVTRVALKAATPGDLLFQIRGVCDISAENSSERFMKVYPLDSLPNLGASYSDLLFVKTSNVNEGSKASIVTFPRDFSATPKNMKIVVTVTDNITGAVSDLIFDKNNVSTNFQRGKRYLTNLDLSAPNDIETVLFRDDFSWISLTANFVNYFDSPLLTNESGITAWPQADKDQGWTASNSSVYARSAGYIKIGKTATGCDFISPALGTKTGLTQQYASVVIRARLSAYRSNGGTLDNASFRLSVSGDGTLAETMPITLANFSQLKTYEFNVTGFTPLTRMSFASGLGLGTIASTNRIFLDDFEIVTKSTGTTYP